MELPVLLLTNGVLLPNAKLKVPVKSKTNLATLDRFIVNKGIPGKSLVLVAYRVEKEKVNLNINFQEKLRSFYELYGCKPRIHQSEISAELRKEFLNRVRELSLSLSFDRIEDSFTLKKFLNEDRMEDLADFWFFSVSLVNDVPYPSLLNYLATLEIPKRVKLANDWLKDHLKTISTAGSRDVRIEQPYLPRGVRQIPHKPAKNNIDELESKLQNAGLPDNVKDRVWAEFERLKGMGQNSSEQHVLTSYLELVASLPWSKSTPESIDIKKVRPPAPVCVRGVVVLFVVATYPPMTPPSCSYFLFWRLCDGPGPRRSRCHVQSRRFSLWLFRQNYCVCVISYFSARHTAFQITGPILCFAGPPGIGKTSIAKAIAQSLGRNFERISLGGIRDESDIRGHRRTYVAAMCGRIIQAMKHAGSNNPLILLDEVDKLFSGLHGSPSAALLEVLDPEQNNSFTDHYLNLPFDLSNVLFIATANDLSKIEGPLADRMEIIEMTGYSTNEKIEIAERHLIPRQLLQHGICPDHLRIQTDALRLMVEDYTRESGVRQLERAIAATCRFVALRIAESVRDENDVDSMMNTELPIIVTAQKCREILGKERFSSLDLVEQMGKFRVGTCFGLAWTPFGGELMVIEANRCAGKGKTVMTGKLGDVLRESVDVARTWIRANAARLADFCLRSAVRPKVRVDFSRLNADNLEGSDIHVHLPSGAVGKDGPSAGCALVAALFSLASGRLVRADTAVTGEISLTGHILPVSRWKKLNSPRHSSLEGPRDSISLSVVIS
ncbi:putative endopeptidase La [Ancylostoma duodenale]|uniref:endopeptidase La n=1 Tax=Ancylostoma duodenale TaxID=51022 RepID=A0A0C2GX56_9BILA|nr:putative endopeptidase La [Ancylostoma duodenale]